MTQSVVVQVGQCGNQIGCRFWDLALREHATVNKSGIYDEPLSSFFRNVDSRYDDPADIPVGSGKGKVRSLKARAVLVDMEEGVVSDIMKGPLKDVFDFRQLITDVSGSGNNWFVTAVYPSAEDDVITSPYNSVLAMRELTEKADCVLPIENQALVDIVNKIGQAVPSARTGKRVYSSVGGNVKAGSEITAGDGGLTKPSDEKPFDSMNNIVANLLLNMTSSARFEGSLNVDLNEITMNLVPFPKLHYLVSSQSPLYSLTDVNLPPRRLDQMFSDSFSKDHQLIKADPKHSLYLACALMVRGNVEISDIRRNIEKLKPNLKFIHWNQEGWKTGLCSVPPAHIHHYTDIDGMEVSNFTESLESLNSLIQEYSDLEKQMNNPPPAEPRLQVLS
ncbi:hypothetical protein KUTeg_000252 [Tegillarca granosa]|uniref:Tubulin/FtsZ 2-layer sandwich domain-containing protein n=1 Tax=Tegillarca granosa TaxID=220873 RepID=A0ABQ9FYD6_TEGGR|nr:hypothetical protein KUTeg_000252 [Tegillarca granosa]